jgi:hypothetical protein
MQTFLPYSSFQDSAEVLDYRRLGKQRVECFQLLKALKQGGGWSKHPAATMWRGYESALENYMHACIMEWIKRGYNNTMTATLTPNVAHPPWLGDALFHASHRSNLLRKDPVHYNKFNWTESNDLPYIWPGASTFFIEPIEPNSIIDTEL